jgi:hypothetical protein
MIAQAARAESARWLRSKRHRSLQKPGASQAASFGLTRQLWISIALVAMQLLDSDTQAFKKEYAMRYGYARISSKGQDYTGQIKKRSEARRRSADR